MPEAGPHVCVFFSYGVSLADWKSGGILERELAVYKELCRVGCKVTIWTYDDVVDDSLLPSLGPIRWMPVGSLGSGRLLPFLRSLWLPLRHRNALSRFDLFKTNQFWGSWVAWVASLMTGKPWVLREGYEYYQFARKMGKASWKLAGIYLLSWCLYRLAPKVVVTSKEISDFAIGTFGLPKERFTVITNYVDTSLFAPSGGAKGDRLIFVGRLSAQKNLPMLIAAVHRAGLGLDVCGGGELESELHRQVKEIGADVRFLGVVSNEKLPGLLSSALAYVLFSHYEGVPKTLLEAMACGCLVIGSDVEGIREFVRDGENGLLVRKDEAELAGVLAGLKEDSNRYAHLAAGAREYVDRNHSLRNVAAAERTLYGELLHEASR